MGILAMNLQILGHAIQQKEKNEIPGRVDVTTLEDCKSFKQIDNEGKELFDFVTSSVWNARKHLINWLRPLYNCETSVLTCSTPLPIVMAGLKVQNMRYSFGWSQ